MGVMRLPAAAIAVTALWTGEVAAQTAPPVCTVNTLACLIATMNLYLQWEDTHDASKIPFAPQVKRWESGILTGDGETHTRALKLPHQKVTDIRAFVDLETKSVFYWAIYRYPDFGLRGTSTWLPRWGAGPKTLHVSERFKVEDGLITEIENVFHWEDGTMFAGSAEARDGMSIGSNNFPYVAPARRAGAQATANPAAVHR